MSAVIFFIAAIGALAGAIGVVSLRNPFYSVLALVGHLLCLAALFLLLNAQFLAAAQVVVYAGAVAVLYVFVVSYVGDGTQPIGIGGARLRTVAALFVGMLFVELCIALLGSGLQAIDSRGTAGPADFGTPAGIGEALLTKFLLPFELASLLLLSAAVGAVMLARRRAGGPTMEDVAYEPGQYITPRSLFSGTMAEAVGAIKGPSEPVMRVRDGYVLAERELRERQRETVPPAEAARETPPADAPDGARPAETTREER